MEKKDIQTYFLLGLIGIAGLVVAFMFLPFLNSLVIATVFVVIFEPIYNRVLKLFRGQTSVASLITILAILIIVFVPVTLMGITVFDQAQGLYLRVTSDTANINPLLKIETTLETKIQELFPSSNIDIDLKQTAELFFKWLTQNIGPIFQGLASVLTSFFLSLLAIYYFFKDGENFKSAIIKVSPLAEKHTVEILNRLKVAIGSVMRGTLTVAIVQGLLAGIGFTIFGVPNAALWGFITVIAALVPILGTSVVLAPIIIYLFAFDTLFSAIGLLAWGALAVGLIDNFLGPKLMQRKIHIHSFLILLSVLGGLSLFGPIGFLIGPLFLALLGTLLDIYPVLVLNRSEEN
ncbi:MAG: AI-2E family transporter [Patescibacteria group bacterium]